MTNAELQWETNPNPSMAILHDSTERIGRRTMKEHMLPDGTVIDLDRVIAVEPIQPAFHNVADHYNDSFSIWIHSTCFTVFRSECESTLELVHDDLIERWTS